MTELTESFLLDHYRKILGRRFANYGYEVWKSIKSVIKHYDPEFGPIEPYAGTVLSNQLKYGFKKAAKENLIPNECRQGSDIYLLWRFEEEAQDLKLDVVRQLGSRSYKVMVMHFVEKMPAHIIGDELQLTVDQVRYRITKLQKFLDRYNKGR